MAGSFSVVPAAAIDSKILNANARVLNALCSYINADGHAWPSLKLLAQDTGLKPQHVARAIGNLVKAGLIVRKRVKSASRGWENNRYTVVGAQRKRASQAPITNQNETGTPEPVNPPPGHHTPPITTDGYLTTQGSIHSGKDSIGVVREVRGYSSVPAREGASPVGMGLVA